VIGNSTARPVMVRSTMPIQSVLMVVFFLSIGLLIDLKFIWENLGTVLLLLLTVTLIKTAVNIGILKLLREPWPHAFVAGIMLAQIGEFSLIISQVAQDRSIINKEAGQLIVAVIAFSLLMSPLWIAIARRLLRVILLSVTSLRGTLEAIETRRMVAAGHYVLDRWRAARRTRRRQRLARKVRRRRKKRIKAITTQAPDTPLLTDQRPNNANKSDSESAGTAGSPPSDKPTSKGTSRA